MQNAAFVGADLTSSESDRARLIAPRALQQKRFIVSAYEDSDEDQHHEPKRYVASQSRFIFYWLQSARMFKTCLTHVCLCFFSIIQGHAHVVCRAGRRELKIASGLIVKRTLLQNHPSTARKLLHIFPASRGLIHALDKNTISIWRKFFAASRKPLLAAEVIAERS
jgi:hypothetical protein